jgi:large subunit ribosomal protein L17
MRHKVKKVRIGNDKSHTTALMKNLAMSVIIYEKIKTTSAKARAVQPLVERLINYGKLKTKGSIRLIMSVIDHENSSKKILEVLADKYKDKTSGYTRITKLGYRTGDNAPVVQLELI